MYHSELFLEKLMSYIIRRKWTWPGWLRARPCRSLKYIYVCVCVCWGWVMDKKPLHLLPSHCLSPTDSHCACCCHVTAHSRNSFNILPGSADHDNLWKFSARSPLKCMRCQASIVNVCAIYAFIWQHQGYFQTMLSYCSTKRGFKDKNRGLHF